MQASLPQILEACLSPHEQTRVQAEHQLDTAANIDGFANVLAVCCDHPELHIRRLAAITLKNSQIEIPQETLLHLLASKDIQVQECVATVIVRQVRENENLVLLIVNLLNGKLKSYYTILYFPLGFPICINYQPFAGFNVTDIAYLIIIWINDTRMLRIFDNYIPLTT